MNYNNPQHQRTEQGIRFLVSSLFCVFTFSYLLKIHGGMLAMAQHVLAHGLTVYNPFVGSLVLTVVLLLFQWLCNLVMRLRGEWFALSFFPSALMLALLTSLDATLYTGDEASFWLWLLPVALLVYGGLVLLSRRILLSPEHRSSDRMVRLLIPNIIVLTCCASFACFWGATEKDLHNFMEMEYALSRGDFQKAASTGGYVQQASRPTTALRAFALARMGEMGDRLFSYPQRYGAEGLLINRSDSVRMLYRPDSIYWHLGALPSAQTPTALKFLHYLDLSERQRKPMAKDYLLAALLLEKQLPEFVKELDKSNPLTDSTVYPRHFQEALVLYRHRVSAVLPYRNAEVEASFEQYQQAVRKGQTEHTAANLAKEEFGHTYWWYYDFATKLEK